MVNGTQQWVLCVKVASTVNRSQSHGALLGYDRKGDLNPGCATNQSRRIVGWHNSMDPDLKKSASTCLTIFDSMPRSEVVQKGKRSSNLGLEQSTSKCQVGVVIVKMEKVLFLQAVDREFDLMRCYRNITRYKT